MTARYISIPLFVLLLGGPVEGSAAVYRVGPARPYQTLQQVTGLLNPGDTVLVDGDAVYPGGVVFRRAGTPAARIVVAGVRVNGRRPVIEGGTDGVTFRTDAPYTGPGADHYTLQGFEVRNATFRGVFHQANDLHLRDLVVHHCPHGILGADQGSGSLLLEYSEVHSCGSGTTEHQVYVATDEVHHPGSVFRMQFCWLHDGTGGNNVKSRAERNEIYYNWIEGGMYHELELIGPDGGDGGNARLKREDSDVVGNVLWKRVKPPGDTEYFSVARLGGDGTGESHGRYRFVNNTILTGSRAVFRLFDSLESVEMHNNVLHRIDGSGVLVKRTVEALWTTGAEVIAGRNNWVQTGSTQVPAQWTGTVTGADPGFVSLAGNDLTPGSGSPLLNAGTGAPQSPPGFPFPSPLFPPAMHPPVRLLLPAGSAAVRPPAGAFDIGAFERPPPASARDDAALPDGPRLGQNYPNPFNPSTRIPFEIAEGGRVRVGVYNLVGQEVARLMDGHGAAGVHTLVWEAGAAPAGVYVVRLETAGAVRVRRIVLLR